MPAGSLTVVGTGIRLSQLTVEARSEIESAEKLLFLVADPVSQAWLADLCPDAESLAKYYSTDKRRSVTYAEIVERILECVREGRRVCVALYGHPGVFATSAHKAIRLARLEGYEARMLPAVSAEDCLFADLGVDPGVEGCQSFEATDFLVSRRRIDPRVPLILWQIGLTGDLTYRTQYDRAGVCVLVEILSELYHPTHEVIVYQAAQYFGCGPTVQKVTLADVPCANLTPASTLFVPPILPTVPDEQMAARLGIWSAFVDPATAADLPTKG
jgi:uncharacterized protein YabN with tetrapyrrole methylase and pyrophosphatase domain